MLPEPQQSLTSQPPPRAVEGLSLDGSETHAAGRHNWWDRRNRWHRYFRFDQTARRCCPSGSSHLPASRRRGQSRDCPLTAPRTVRQDGTIGGTGVTAEIVVFVSTRRPDDAARAAAVTYQPAAAAGRRGTVPRRLRDPCGRTAQLVGPAQPLASFFSFRPNRQTMLSERQQSLTSQPPPRAVEGLSLDGSETHAAGRHNWWDRRNR
jgi:hypothetical protein